tara:strand:- start:12370 stop:13266 length:897 start_codon:yes stop_codon:yes gene_type:complete
MIKQDYTNLKTFVINLDDYKKNYEKQLPYLKNIGLNVERFRGVNALKDEHLKPEYKQYISNFAYNFTPKSIIGCSLSHMLCCKYIYDKYIAYEGNESSNKDNIPFFLIMEDDAFPKYLKSEFYERLNKTIYTIQILDPNWEIIQLHSDSFFPTINTYTTHFACGSTAAYLISELGLKKNLKYKILHHTDFIDQNFIRFKKYRAKENIFYTNEKESLNRNINTRKNLLYYSLFIKSYLLEFINKYTNLLELRGEKSYANLLEFKLVKLPYFKKECTVNEIIDSIFGLFILKKLYILKNK